MWLEDIPISPWLGRWPDRLIDPIGDPSHNKSGDDDSGDHGEDGPKDRKEVIEGIEEMILKICTHQKILSKAGSAPRLKGIRRAGRDR